MSLVAVLFAVVACSTKQTADGVIPAEPNYEESSQWYITDRHADADIFYIISTETGDYNLATDYIIPLIGKEGCYHSREIWLYRDQLRDNIALRTARYLK